MINILKWLPRQRRYCKYYYHYQNFHGTNKRGTGELHEEYEELKQLKDIKSPEFYEEEGKRRNYFYYVDLQGRLFLEDTAPKNIATSLKSDKFLNFFFRQLKCNKTNNFNDYPYFSPCGKESNYIKCADTPVVFSEILKDEKKEGDNNYKLVWGHSLSIPFQPDKLRISIDTGRLYHPFPVKNAKKFGQSTMFGLLKSHLTISISNRIGSYGNNNFNNNGNDDDWYFEWGDKKHKIEVV